MVVDFERVICDDSTGNKMQIQYGTVSVTNGDSNVVASVNVDWTDAQIALQQGTPVFFSLQGTTEIPMQVIAVTQPSLTASGFWELTLIEPWEDDTLTDQLYVIHKDFTLFLGLAIPSPGDRQWAQLYARNVNIIDATLGQGVLFNGTEIAGNTTVYVPNGKTLYSSGLLEIPVDSELDILVGGRVEIG